MNYLGNGSYGYGMPALTSSQGAGMGGAGGSPNSGMSMGALGDAYSEVNSGAPAQMDLGQYGYLQDQANQANAGIQNFQTGGYQNSLTGAGVVGGSVAQQMGNTVQGLGGTQQQIAGNVAGLGNTADMLGAQAAGTSGPSAAQAQLQQGMQQAQAAAMAQAGSARGNFGLAGAQKNALNTGANLAQQTNQATAIQRAQEQLNAQQQLVAAQNAQVQGNMGIGQLQQAQLAGQQGIGNIYNQAGQLGLQSGQLQNAMAQNSLQGAQLAGTTANQGANLQLQNNAQNLGAQQFNVGEGDKELGGIMGAVGSLGSMAAM